MQQWRWTIRRGMSWVVVLAVGLGLAIPAVRVATSDPKHTHEWRAQSVGLRVPGFAGGTFGSSLAWTCRVSESMPSPFWPRYGRLLLGRPPRCDQVRERPDETCSWEAQPAVKAPN